MKGVQGKKSSQPGYRGLGSEGKDVVCAAISAELHEKLVAFVDREAGLDAPLTFEEEVLVLDLLDRDAAVHTLVEEMRTINVGLNGLLDAVAAIEVSDKLIALIRSR